jgi:hypothetical protein
MLSRLRASLPEVVVLLEEFASLAVRVKVLRAVPKPKAEKPPGADWMPPIPSDALVRDRGMHGNRGCLPSL